jgi:LCP family protein required for cell wall assembly
MSGQSDSVRRWLEERQAEREARQADQARAGSVAVDAPSAVAPASRQPPASSWDSPAPPAPPTYPSPPDARPVPPAPAPRRRRRWGWGRRIALMILVLLAIVVGLGAYWDSTLHRVDAFASYAGRPSGTSGTNWLLVGSDSRSNLTDAQRKALATGNASGGRTDTIMLLHTGSGPTSLISIPRDSYVPIPGHGSNKINAAFAFGGPKLLTQTVEQATGLRINHYAEIGFGGFASVVDAVGGVRMCIAAPINDPKAGLTLAAGCQTLNGAQALGYVRTRATPLADLDRVRHQREFLSALASKVASPSKVLNPLTVGHVVTGSINAVNVDNGAHIWTLARLGLALRGVSHGSGVTITVPTSGSEVVSGAGDVLLWDRAKALRLFHAIATGSAIPADIVTG